MEIVEIAQIGFRLWCVCDLFREDYASVRTAAETLLKLKTTN